MQIFFDEAAERGGHGPTLHARILFLAQHILYLVPANKRPCLADHHQRAVDKYENVTRYVKRLPQVPGRPTDGARGMTGHRALAKVLLEPVECAGPEVPEKRSDRQPDGMLSDGGPRVQVKYLAAGHQKRGGTQQRPEPAQLDQVLVEKRVAVSEVYAREAHEVTDHGGDQQP